VISLRCRTPRPHWLEFYFRPASRITVLVLCFSEILGVGAGNFSFAGNKHQEPYAVIFGTVWGPDDHPLYGVKVKIRRQHEKKARWELYSDHNGEFAQRVPAGKQDYVVWADAKSYKAQNGRPLQGDEVAVHVDDDERVDTGLHLK
jgi:hypothetical protein